MTDATLLAEYAVKHFVLALLLLLATPALARDVLVTEPLAAHYPVRLELKLPWSRTVLASGLITGDCVRLPFYADMFARRTRLCWEHAPDLCSPFAAPGSGQCLATVEP